jgi:hypothetical protein
MDRDDIAMLFPLILNEEHYFMRKGDFLVRRKSSVPHSISRETT